VSLKILASISIFLIAAACGDDDTVTPPDGSVADGSGGTMDGDTPDGGEEIDCTGMPDGASCGEGFICFSEVCVPSRCGDGFVDAIGGEECDDENEIAGDGCEPASCSFSCADDTACDDMFPCNGAESCNVSLHRCQAGTPMDGVACVREEDGSDGVCAGGLCASPGCGNGVVDSGEECDDSQNGDNTDGCRDDCTFTCESDAECQNGDACDGAETCTAASHTCASAAALDCNDGDPCTTDSCEMSMGCANVLIDVDGDGFAPGTCTTSGLMGGDCNDTNSSVFPGAAELCDSIDNDCDGMVDDSIVMVTCYRDADGDGYGNMSSSMTACSCPAGYIPPRADGLFDCKDCTSGGGASVNPGQTNYFPSEYCPSCIALCLRGTGSHDYNCDRVETRRWTRTNRTSCGITDCTDGWTGSTVPDCGVAASFRNCSFLCTIGGSCSCSTTSVGTVTQECR
jgi:cysteine-rich repeat protein